LIIKKNEINISNNYTKLKNSYNYSIITVKLTKSVNN